MITRREIVEKVDGLRAQGLSGPVACEKVGVPHSTYMAWRKIPQAKLDLPVNSSWKTKNLKPAPKKTGAKLIQIPVLETKPIVNKTSSAVSISIIRIQGDDETLQRSLREFFQ